MIRFPIWIITFLLTGLTKLVLTILGFFIIPLAVLFKAYEEGESKISWTVQNVQRKKIMRWKLGIMYPWGNEEDGIVAGEEFPDKPLWFRIIYWSAIRNPANNLRYIKFFSPIPEPKKVNYVASFKKPHISQDLISLKVLEEKGSFWYMAWQKNYANFRWQFWIGKSLWRIWIGTKIYPSSIHEIQEYQKHGIGTTFQIKNVTRFE